MDKLFNSPGAFTPNGCLSQVEYAMEAVENSNDIIVIQTINGFLIGTEVQTDTEIEDDRKYPRNIFLIDKHIIIGVSGNIPDSKIIVDYVRIQAQQYRFVYQEDIPLNEVVKEICNIKQQFSQSKTSRPMGCSLIIAGWDRFSGHQLFKSDASGTISNWKAVTIGSNSLTNQIILETEFKNGISLTGALALLVRIIKKKTSYTVPSKIFDVHTFIIDHEKNILIHRLSKKELNSLVKV
jgi:20S proteasome subunit alpha 3